MFNTIDVLTSGLVAQRTRMNVAADNLANIRSTRDQFGNIKPYKPKRVVFEVGVPEKGLVAQGVRVKEVKELDQFRIEHLPNHPDADAEGNVKFPDINMFDEYVDAIEAGRAYEMNATALEVSKQMMGATIRLLA